MFTVLLESRAARRRRLGSTLASAAVHGAIVAGAVALTLPGRGDARIPTPPDVHTVTYVAVPHRPSPPVPAPPKTPAQQAALPRLVIPTIAPPTVTPTSLPPLTLGPTLEPDQIRIGGASHGPLAAEGSVAGPALASGGELDAALVDRAPRAVGRLAEPRYPAALRAAGIEGEVIAEFVVDTLGRAELDGVRFPVSANPLFEPSVREALARYRFAPGEVSGRRVRTRVRLPFQFRLDR